MRRALALLILIAVTPAAAAAHGMLDRTEPRAGSSVKAPPGQVRLWFTGALEPAYSRVRVMDAAGKRIDLGDSTLDPANAALLRVSVPALGPGTYRVVWRVLSVDSHVTEGEFFFRIES
jgi:methionine-rich copper-binding protein CopC